jgi:general secretion pathway protein A
MAGGDASKLFTREAVTLIHQKSRGIPRVISVMCDNALISGSALGRHTVDRAIVAEVARDFDLGADDADHEPKPAVVRIEPAPVQEPPSEPAEGGMFASVGGRRRFSLFRGR